MSFWRGLAVIGPVMAILLAVIGPVAPAEALKSGIGGYRQIIDSVLIPERILLPTDHLEEARRSYGTRPRGPVVLLDERRLAAYVADNREFASLPDFVEQSFLRADLARNDPGLWLDDNILLGFAQEAHVVTSPFDTLNWTGNLLYQGDAPVATFLSFEDESRWFELTGKDGQRFGDESKGFYAAALLDRRVELTTDPGGLLLFETEPRFERFRLSAEVTARYCGSDDPVRTSPDPRDLVLTPGVCVELRSTRSPGFRPLRLIQLTQSKVISEDPGLQLSGPASLPYARLARSVRTSLSNWVQDKCGGNCPESEKNIVSSLDPQISRFAQNVVTGAARDFGFRRSVGVTVMDGRNGNILAMASIDGNPLYRRDPRQFQEDLNFIDLTIGSAAKPLIAQAIFAQEESGRATPSEPDFSELEILDTEPRLKGNKVLSVLKVPLGGTLEAMRVAGRGGWVNASEFIGYSSNYYAAGLVLLASCKREEARGSANGTYRGVAANVLPCVADARQTAICPPWRNAFNSLYINDAASTAVGSDRCRPSAEWRPAYMPVWSHGDLPSAMADHLPRPYALAWNFTDLISYRSQVMNMMIGGQAYPWNNILLAQSYARLVTGRQVEASLTYVPGRREKAVLQLGRTKPVCDGLADVATKGTARGARLPDLLDRWSPPGRRFDLVLLSKTGTPTVEGPSNSETLRIGAINACIRSSRLRLERPGNGGQGGWRLAGPSCAGVQPQAVAEQLAGIGDESIEAGDVTFNVWNGRLVKAIAQIDSSYKPKVYVFALSQRRGANEGERLSGCHQVSERGPVLVVAINVNDPNAKENLAHLEIARRLLAADGALRSWFVRQVR
ncbi:MAG TPA: hypothetical protein VFQ67_01910 [Allosphingosinicella sp.]|jgi:hypothetical protein|nr:hypothetical protein [Allosphingosinicella sp.]